MSDQGKLLLAKASSEGFKPLGVVQMPAAGRYWTVPAFSRGRVFIRNASGDGFCVDVRKQQQVEGATTWTIRRRVPVQGAGGAPKSPQQ